MNFIERIEEIRKKEQEARDGIERLEGGLEHDEWIFSVHAHYEEPRVSVWKMGDDSDICASFIIKGDCVELRSAGMYWDDWHEAESVLNEWLSQDFSE